MMNTGAILTEWNRCRDWLLPALTDATEDEVMNDLFLGRAQLWGGDGAAMVTQLVPNPEPHVCLWMGGGDLRSLLALGPGVKAWARAQGAVSARVWGRAGWARVLRGWGFVPDGEQMRLAI